MKNHKFTWGGGYLNTALSMLSRIRRFAYEVHFAGTTVITEYAKVLRRLRNYLTVSVADFQLVLRKSCVVCGLRDIVNCRKLYSAVQLGCTSIVGNATFRSDKWRVCANYVKRNKSLRRGWEQGRFCNVCLSLICRKAVAV